MNGPKVVSVVTVPLVVASLGAAVAVAAPAKHDRGVVAVMAKDKDKNDKGKPEDTQTAPATPAPAPAPATKTAPSPAPAPAPSPATGKDKGKGKDKPKSAAPTPASAPAPAPTPGASVAPTVSFESPSLAPAQGQSAGVATATGVVRVRTQPGGPVHVLVTGSSIPVGARVDATDGRVELTTAVDSPVPAQTATFAGAVFTVRQAATGEGLTRIVLVGGDFSRCHATAAGVAHAATVARPQGKPIRHLWGKDSHGRFQTSGKGAVGTVRGTHWLTEDYCNGTLTRVVEGAVSVRDLAKHKTVLVRAGHSYFAAR